MVSKQIVAQKTTKNR